MLPTGVQSREIGENIQPKQSGYSLGMDQMICSIYIYIYGVNDIYIYIYNDRIMTVYFNGLLNNVCVNERKN